MLKLYQYESHARVSRKFSAASLRSSEKRDCDRLARAARKRQKASVQALGRDVGGVDEAVKGHKRQQEERAELYRQAEVNITENSATFRKSGWKQNDVAMRMSMSCPMCGFETMHCNLIPVYPDIDS